MPKIQYSKILPVISFLVFIACVIKAFTVDIESMVDMSVYATAITVSGGIVGACVTAYLKKSASENAYKLRMGLYENTVKQRLFFNEEMLKLKEKYNASDEDICDIDQNGEIDEFMSDALSSTTDAINTAQNDADAFVEVS